MLFPVLLALAVGSPAFAKPAKPPKKPTLIDFVRARDELSGGDEKKWESEVRKRFGAAATSPMEDDTLGEAKVARAILASAMFFGVPPAKGVLAAFEGYRGALGYVPPPVAVHYQNLVFQGREPRGRPIDLAFNFPKYYVDEIAPDLVAYWETALTAGKIPDLALEETKAALTETRVKMRPLLLDKLRLLSRLVRESGVARGTRKAEIEANIRQVEAELARAFTGVARRPEVLDVRKRPYDRLRIQLEDTGQAPTEDDRYLDPDGVPPPKRAPTVADPMAEVRAPEPDSPGQLSEPQEAPVPPPPPQPRAGDPQPELEPLPPTGVVELVLRYSKHLAKVIAPWLGTPYLWGGAASGEGTDSAGFALGVFRLGFGIELPRITRDQFLYGRSVSKSELQPGDLVFFDTQGAGPPTHVGVFTGKGKFVHASITKGVISADLDARPYAQTFRGARRMLAYPASAGR